MVQPTRQLDRVRGQETAGVGIVVTMPVVVQAGFRVVVLALETQRVVDFRHFQAGDVAVGAVAGRPEDFAAVAGQFLRSAQVVELVVEGLGLQRAFAVQHGQRAEAAGFVDLVEVAAFAALGDHPAR